jgi:hypothetical protein
MDSLKRFYPSMLPKGCVCFFSEPSAFMFEWAELQRPVTVEDILYRSRQQQTIVLRQLYPHSRKLLMLNLKANLGKTRYFLKGIPPKFKYRNGPGVLLVVSFEESKRCRQVLNVLTNLGYARIDRLMAEHRRGDALVIKNNGNDVSYYSHSRPLLHWSPETHVKFSQEFQDQVATLLAAQQDVTSIFHAMPLNVLHEIIALLSLIESEFYFY